MDPRIRILAKISWIPSTAFLVICFYFAVLVLYCLISSPLLLIVMGAAGGACYLISIKNQETKLSIAGETPPPPDPPSNQGCGSALI
jgi:hypothetical protein